MAVQAKEYLDLTGLQTYDTLIKNWANSPNQSGYKKIIVSSDNNYLYFYKDAAATISSTPDATVSLGGGDLTGKINAMATTLGFTYDSQTGTYSFSIPEGMSENTTVADCISYLHDYISDTYSKVPVTVEEANGSSGSDILKSYTFYQGLTGQESAAQKEAKRITTVNIPKDYVVKSATVETVTVADNPYVGAEVGDKYIDFVINTKDGSGSGTAQHIYIPFKDLMHPISGSTGTEVTVAVDSNNQISASINEISGTKVIYSEGAAGENDVTVNAALGDIYDELDTIKGDSDTRGSMQYYASKAYDRMVTHVEQEIDGLTLAEPLPLMRLDDEGRPTLPNYLDQQAGLVDLSSDSLFTLAKVADSGNAEDVEYDNHSSSLYSENVQEAIDEIVGTYSDTEDSLSIYGAKAYTRAYAEQYVATEIGNALEALDTSTDVPIAYVSGDRITLENGIKQENGLIAQGTGDQIEIRPIRTTLINSLFSAS
jgi:hypothetical protein